MNKISKFLFVFVMISVLMLTGCGGSSNSKNIIPTESPEEAVARISASWKENNSSPNIIVNEDNRFVRMAGEDPANKSIKLYDLSGNTYQLNVKNTVSDGTNASVLCEYVYDGGLLNIVFALVFDEGKWWLDGVAISDKPLEPGTAVYTVYHYQILSDDSVNLLDSETESLIGNVGKTVTALPKQSIIDSGLDWISDYKETVATGTVAADSSLVLKLYYKKLKAVYKVEHVKLNSDNSIAEVITEELKALIGSNVTAVATDTIKGFTYMGDNYSVEGTDIKTVLSGVVADNDSLVLRLYYKMVNGISGTILDSEKAPVIGAKVQAFNSSDMTKVIGETTTDNNGFYLLELPAGEYLLVVTKPDFEPQTIGPYTVK